MGATGRLGGQTRWRHFSRAPFDAADGPFFADPLSQILNVCPGSARNIRKRRPFLRMPRENLLYVCCVLMVTGPVTWNMREALERTYHATPDPKWVVAIGDCARDGGCFAGSYAVVGGVSEVIPVDLHISGCPPTPTAMLRGLLALLERADTGAVTS